MTVGYALLLLLLLLLLSLLVLLEGESEGQMCPSSNAVRSVIVAQAIGTKLTSP